MKDGLPAQHPLLLREIDLADRSGVGIHALEDLAVDAEEVFGGEAE